MSILEKIEAAKIALKNMRGNFCELSENVKKAYKADEAGDTGAYVGKVVDARDICNDKLIPEANKLIEMIESIAYSLENSDEE